jgi:hypothetical protein
VKTLEQLDLPSMRRELSRRTFDSFHFLEF